MKNILNLLIIAVVLFSSCGGECCSKEDAKLSKKECSHEAKKECKSKSKKECSKESKKACKFKSEAENNDETQNEDHSGKHNMILPDDNRISLGVTGKRAKHQLINMRDHVVAVNLILNHLSKNEFDEASDVALEKLGPSKHMMKMCSAFENEEFEKIGFAFHESAKTMSEIIKTKDMNKSLEALTTTTGYCVSCHARFKQ